MFFIPLILASIDSSFDVTSISITRAELLGMEKLTVNPGSVLDGASFTGNSGTSAIPIKATLKNATMMVKEDILFFCFDI